MDHMPIPRRSARRPVAMTAQCRASSGLRDTGQILDLTAEGCCVVTNGLFVKVGARVLVRPQGLEGLTGVVRWIAGTRAGIEFDTPIYGPVFEHLSSMHASRTPVGLGNC